MERCGQEFGGMGSKAACSVNGQHHRCSLSGAHQDRDCTCDCGMVLPPLASEIQEVSSWEKITCQEREDLLRRRPDLVVSASKTDIGGEYGEPEIYTEWSGPDEVPVLREHRWPAEDFNGDDVKPCEHYKAAVS